MSHVPQEMFEPFWELVESALRPGGSVLFVDSLHSKTSPAIDHRLEEKTSTMTTRKLNDGRSFRIVKIFYDPGKIIDCCAALLKPGGTLFFSTINRNLKSFLFAIIGAEYVLRMLPRGTHHYSKLIKPQEIDQWAGANGFSLADVSSFMYNPFTKTFKLKPRADVNYITCYKPR